MLKRNSDPNSTQTRTDDGGDVDRTERGSVWDVPVDWREKFWGFFSVLMVASAGFETWLETTFGEEPTPWHRFSAIIEGTVPYTALAAPISVLLTEGIRLLSEKYRQKRYRVGREEGVQIGEQRGEKRGEKRGEIRGVGKGVHIGAQAILDWLERRDAATAAGIPFDEPPPDPTKIASQANGSANGSNGSAKAATGTALPDMVASAVDEALTDLVQWSVRKGVAEALGQPFNEPHPHNRNGNGTRNRDS